MGKTFIAELLERRRLLTQFALHAIPLFEDPAPSTAATNGTGTSQFTWGTPLDSFGPSSLVFNPATINTDPAKVFSLGELFYANGTITGGTGVTAIDLSLSLTFDKPKGLAQRTITRTLGISNTTNSNDAAASADIISLGGGEDVTIAQGKKRYGLKILGFGELSGPSFSPLDQFVVNEHSTTGAQLLAQFLPLPDLVLSNFTYTVVRDKPLGPIPIGSPFQLTAKIKNGGAGTSAGTTAGVYASLDSTIDPTKDVLIGSMDVPTLSGNHTAAVSGQFTLPNGLSTEFHGKVFLGIAVDPNDTIAEGDEQNNWSQGKADTRQISLYDRVTMGGKWVDQAGTPLKFSTHDAAADFLTGYGFSDTLIPHTDSGWSRPTSFPTFSRFNGKLMAAGMFRIQASISPDPMGGFIIKIWGGEPSFNPARFPDPFPEPSPRAAELNILLDPGWFRYVKDYHDRF